MEPETDRLASAGFTCFAKDFYGITPTVGNQVQILDFVRLVDFIDSDSVIDLQRILAILADIFDFRR